MREKRSFQHHIDAVASLILLAVFAVTALAVLLTGAGAYERLTERDSRAYDLRTAAQYIATRVRQADQAGEVSVETRGGVSVLTLIEDYDGVAYRTAVYAWGGTLRELFSDAEMELDMESGEIILSVQYVSFTMKNDRLTYCLTTAEGDTVQQTLTLRSGAV